MPLGYITLLSRKGGRYDENETPNPPSFLRCRRGRRRTFSFWVFMMNVVHASFTVCYDCTICVYYYYLRHFGIVLLPCRASSASNSNSLQSRICGITAVHKKPTAKPP